MKDRQVESTPAQLRIPFVSAALHYVSMTVIVFLRHSFGYAYLRPKIVFFAFTWAFALFTIFAWKEKTVWASSWTLCLFGSMATALYWTHLGIAYVRELRGIGQHDNDSGTPLGYLLRTTRSQEANPEALLKWKMLVEPAAILGIALVLYLGFAERQLSRWLIVASAALATKEYLNFWFFLRHKKRQRDSFEDADENLEAELPEELSSGAQTGRKDKVKRIRLN